MKNKNPFEALRFEFDDAIGYYRATPGKRNSGFAQMPREFKIDSTGLTNQVGNNLLIVRGNEKTRFGKLVFKSAIQQISEKGLYLDIIRHLDKNRTIISYQGILFHLTEDGCVIYVYDLGSAYFNSYDEAVKYYSFKALKNNPSV